MIGSRHGWTQIKRQAWPQKGAKGAKTEFLTAEYTKPYDRRQRELGEQKQGQFLTTKSTEIAKT